MAKQANRLMIGGFVVLAVLIMAASLVVFGSGKFFKTTDEYVLFFDGSIKGLTVGSPVLFQGVPIGAVKNIVLEADVAKEQINKPVYIEVEPDRFNVESNGKRTRLDRLKSLPVLIKKGMRAVLSTQSLITGQLMIELDFYPGTPVNLKGLDKEYPEIPTIPSTTERLGKALEKLDLNRLQSYLESALAGIDHLVNNKDLKQSLTFLRDTLANARQLVQHVDTKVDPLTEHIDGTIGDARKLLGNVDAQVKPLAGNVNGALGEYRKLARDVNRQVVEPLGPGLDKTLNAIVAAANEATKTLRSVEGMVNPDSAVMRDLTTTLRELSSAARSIRVWASYLERHPEALIRGKGK